MTFYYHLFNMFMYFNTAIHRFFFFFTRLLSHFSSLKSLFKILFFKGSFYFDLFFIRLFLSFSYHNSLVFFYFILFYRKSSLFFLFFFLMCDLFYTTPLLVEGFVCLHLASLDFFYHFFNARF